jgi:hypothetical protein
MVIPLRTVGCDPSPKPFLKGSGQGCPLLRASSEYVFYSALCEQEGHLAAPSHPSARSRCASTGEQPGYPILPSNGGCNSCSAFSIFRYVCPSFRRFTPCRTGVFAQSWKNSSINQSLLRYPSFWLSGWSHHCTSSVAVATNERRSTMFSLMFMMLFSLLPFPMLAVVMAVERLKKPVQDEP